jgi:hypothetical protein
MPPPDSNPQLPDELILEGIVVSRDEHGVVNIAPMGPRVDRELNHFVLRPFQTAKTFRNLKSTARCTFQVTDDVLLLARAAVGLVDPPPQLTAIGGFECPRLADTCRWFALEVESIEELDERSSIRCSVVSHGNVRPFWGFNRAKHAVLEAAILATRVGILPADDIRREMERLSIPVQKTAGHQELEAFDLLHDYIATHLGRE